MTDSTEGLNDHSRQMIALEDQTNQQIRKLLGKPESTDIPRDQLEFIFLMLVDKVKDIQDPNELSLFFKELQNLEKVMGEMVNLTASQIQTGMRRPTIEENELAVFTSKLNAHIVGAEIGLRLQPIPNP